MSNSATTVRERVARKAKFTCSEVRAWMAVDDDLDLWSAVYHLLGENYYCIEPEPGMEMTCSFMLRYLLRCIRENPPPNHVYSGYEAAWALADCLKHWSSKGPTTDAAVRLAEREIADAFVVGDRAVQDRLLNGTLEHALEAARLRPFFAHWAHNPALNEAWGLAMEWAVAHGDSAEK